MPETDTPVRLTAEIGHSGLQISGGIVHEEFDPDLRGLRGIKVYEEMRRNDPTVAVGLRLIKWVCGQVQWRVEPGGETPADVKAAEFLDSCRQDMSITWSKLIRDALTCCDFGFAWLEWTMKQRRGPEADPPSRHDDGLIGWRKISLIGHSSWDSWDVDEKGGPRAFLQAGNYLNTVYVPPARIPIEKSILFRLDDEKNNPDGVSLLRSAYRPWWIKKNTEEVEAIGIERDLTGVLIIHLPVGATATDKAKAQDLLEQFKADDMAGFIAPQFGPGDHERWRFEIIGSPGNKTIDTDKTIQRYQTEIARNFLAQFLMLGSGKTGSFALSKDQSDIFEVAIGAILQNLEETMNRFLVPPLFRFNDLGKLTKLPELRAGRVNRKDLTKFATGMKALGDGGFITANKTLEQFIRGEFELPELTKEEMEEPEPEPTTPPGQEPGKQSGQLPEEDTGTAKDAAKQQSEAYRLAGGHAGHKGQHAGHSGEGSGEGARQQKENAIRNSSVEHSVVFDPDGNVVVETSQDSKSMVIMGPSQVNKIRATKGAVPVHNHPEDAPPSPNDFQAAWGMRVKEIKVVSPEFDYKVSVDKYQTWEKVQKASQKATQKLAAEQVTRIRKGESVESVTKGQSEAMHKILSGIVAKIPGVTYTRSAL